MSAPSRAMFLSASFPSGDRGRDVAPFDSEAIADAVTAVVRAALRADMSVVFGGHPTISPLVLMIGAELGAHGKVEIYQSRWFKGAITPETLRLIDSGVGAVHWTDRRPTRAESLTTMRNRMFEHGPMAAVFIGGMDGLYEEHQLFKTAQPRAMRIPLGAPGGASARLRIEPGDVSEALLPRLDSAHYPYLAALVVSEILATP